MPIAIVVTALGDAGLIGQEPAAVTTVQVDAVVTDTRIVGGCGAGCCAEIACGWAHHIHTAQPAERIARGFTGKKRPGLNDASIWRAK